MKLRHIFTFHFSLFTFHFSLFTFHFSLRVAALKEHNKAVTTMCVSPDHAFFVTGSDDGTLKVWTAQGPRSMLEGGKLEGGKLEGVGRSWKELEVGRSWKEGSWNETVERDSWNETNIPLDFVSAPSSAPSSISPLFYLPSPLFLHPRPPQCVHVSFRRPSREFRRHLHRRQHAKCGRGEEKGQVQPRSLASGPNVPPHPVSFLFLLPYL